MNFNLAQLNVARLRKPLDHVDTAEFVAAIDPVNALAEATPGFVWRLQGEDGESSSYVELDDVDDPNLIVNYSIWESLDALRHYAYKSGHGNYFKRRRDWFEKTDEATNVCWWVPAGTIPDVNEAYKRLEYLRAHGPSEEGWPFGTPFPPPSA